MGISLRGKNEVIEYCKVYGQVGLKSVSLSTIEYLLKKENMSIKEIAELFKTTSKEVKELMERNGI